MLVQIVVLFSVGQPVVVLFSVGHQVVVLIVVGQQVVGSEKQSHV